MNRFILINLLIINTIHASLQVSHTFQIPIELEHATTPEQLNWGLMQRRELRENQGMTFNYPRPVYLSMWMFNCWVDLSVAFLDERKVIREIAPLYAHPERMDPAREVRNTRDFYKYSFNEPNMQKFMQEAAACSFPCRFVLEMNQKWFEGHEVKRGDAVVWQVGDPKGYVIRTLDLSPYIKEEGEVRLQFPASPCCSLYFPEGKSCEVIFELNGKEVGRGCSSPRNNPVIYKGEVTSILIIASQDAI